MTDIYAQLVAGIEEMQLSIPPEAIGIDPEPMYIQQYGRGLRICKPRSVSDILNNPARLAYDFKVQQARDRAKLNLTLQIVEGILSEKLLFINRAI